jgi:tetratricopeptide (TPR) repeat protein
MTEATALERIPCPNPLCAGFVSPDQSKCDLCAQELGPCPNCGKLMSRTIGRCGRCGYRQEPTQATSVGSPAEAAPLSIPTETQPTPGVPLVVAFEASRPPVTEQLAEAYHQVAAKDADMREATRVLEQIRSSFLTERDALRIWKLLSEEIGSADPASLRPALIKLRTWFEQQLFAQQERRLRELFERNADLGWREWLRTFAEALCYWRLTLAQSLVDLSLPFPEQFRSPHDFKSATRLILHERWTEVYQFFPYLSGQEFLHSNTRARLLITAAQIHLYYFPQPESALSLLQQADALAPGTGRIIAALGDYYLQQTDFETARSYLDKSLAAAPDEVEGYIYLGDLVDKQGKPEEARTWYQEAINKIGGDSLGYTRLLRLYGRPEFIEKYESHIMPLAQRAAAVDETGEYRVYLDVGDAYLASKRFDTAQAKYQEAVELEPDRLDAYTWKGFAYLEEGNSKFESAHEAFTKAIEVAPDAYNGYWGMGQLCERQEQWAEAADWYARVGQKQPELQTSMLSRIAQMRRELGQFEAAEAALLEALKLDGSTEDALLELADEYYQKQDKMEEALGLFKQMRDIEGESFEAVYQNRVGNVCFIQEKYEEAAQHYLNAINSDNKQAVYHSNLAGVYGPLKRWAEAREHLKVAFDLDGDQQEYETKASLSYNDEGNFLYAQGQFEQAVNCYTEAERLWSASPRYPWNRALAFEQVASTSPNPIELLDRALKDAHSALERAQSIEAWASQLDELSDQVDRLERKRKLVTRCGPIVLALDPKDNPIRISVGSDLAAVILNPEGTDLSDEFVKKIAALREHILREHGLFVPSLNFSPIEVPDPQANYQIQVIDQSVSYGQLAVDQDDPQEEFAQRIELALIPYLDKLCGHQEAANLLDQCETENCVKTRNDPYQLHKLTLKLKEVLAKGESIVNVAQLCAELAQSGVEGDRAVATESQAPAAEQIAPGIESVTFYLSNQTTVNREELIPALTGFQAFAFNTFGIIIPQIVVAESDTIGQDDFQIQFNDEKLAPVDGLAPDELWIQAPLESVINSFPDARAMDYVGQPGCVVRQTDEARRELEHGEYVAFGPLDYIGYCLGTEVRQRIHMFLLSETVEHYLSILSLEFPALIGVTRFFFSAEELTERSREQLKSLSSIKNFPQVLERLLNSLDGAAT